MRRFELLSLAALLAASGCGSERKGQAEARQDDTSPRCLAYRACLTPCAEDSQCQPGEVCTTVQEVESAPVEPIVEERFCARPVPTATSYIACVLDADCGRGDHCMLGVCRHDCLSDRECVAPLLCSDRGRCVAEESLGQSVVPVLPSTGRPVASPSFLDFGAAGTTVAFTLTNAREAPFDFHVQSSRPWLSVSPCAGRVEHGAPVTITVTLDRAAARADNGEGGSVAVSTSAGNLKLGVGLLLDLSGSWSGVLRVTAPLELGEQPLVVNFTQSASVLTGFVDAARSPLYPLKAPLNGVVYQTPSDEVVTLSFDLPGPVDSPQNPGYPQPIIRHFNFVGTRTGAGTLAGTFTETFDGILDSVQTSLAGTASFVRTGPMSAGQPDSMPAVTLISSTNPLAGLATTCGTCPGGSACGSNAVNNMRAFLRATDGSGQPKLAFYKAFFQAGQASGTNPFTSMDSCIAGTTCTAPYDATSLRCAQYWAWMGLSAGVSDADSGPRLLDTLEVTADYALYKGNAYAARALDSWYNPDGALDQELALLATAERAYLDGLHGTTATAPAALQSPYFTGVLGKMSVDAVANSGISELTTPIIGADGSTRGNGEHLRRALGLIDAALFAGNERADLQRRLRRDSEAAVTARAALVRAWVSMAAIAPALAKSPDTWSRDASSVATGLSDAARRVVDIALGRNMFGYAPAYVPFFWHYTSGGGTNFTQIKALADSNLGVWTTLYDEASSAQRAFEASASGLANELSSQLATVDLQLADLCGGAVVSVDDCGALGVGLVADQVRELEAAALRIEEIDRQMSNVHAAIEIEDLRAATVAGVYENQAVLIEETGERVYLADRAIREIETERQMAQGLVGSIIGAATNPSSAPLVLAGGIFNAAIGAAASSARETEEKKRAALITAEQAQVVFDQATVELTNSAAAVKREWLALKVLEIDRDIAVINLAQAYSRLQALWSKAQALLAESARVSAIAETGARYALHYRVLANARARRATAAMHDALRFGYLATRALEYQLVETYGGREALWGIRDPSGLLQYLQGLTNKAGSARTSQSNRDVISLRDDILGLTETIYDAVTGAEVTPAEQLRWLIADPGSWDADGNLHITFSTASPGQEIFSSAVCSDRVQTVGANLIGDALGADATSAYIKLVHGGTSYLRACRRGASGEPELLAYDMTTSGNGPSVARLHASINGMTDGTSTPDLNVELTERAMLASSWALIIELGDNPRLDLLGLDDIELIFTHDSYTIQ